MAIEIGKLEKCKFTDVWKNENEFSDWLADDENIKSLEKAINIQDLVVESREQPVGRFKADIFATYDTGKKIIIENQLNQTNHDHLGKILTYAAGVDASVVIWIAEKATDEHTKTIEYLNEHTDDTLSFFLIEIELWKIGNSKIAHKFNIISRPNEWARQMKQLAKVIPPAKQLQLDFWTGLREYIESIETTTTQEFNQRFNMRTPRAQHWYDLAIGTTKAHISLTADTQNKNIRAMIYIDDDKDLYKKLYEQSHAIEEEFGSNLEWSELPESRASKIQIKIKHDIQDESKRVVAYEWLTKTCVGFIKVFKKYI